jgi:hypothetical protein
MPAVDIRERLNLLLLERLEVQCRGLGASPEYSHDLEDEIAECRTAYVRAAVAEIAGLRAQLSGRQVG